jgi:hypothetical protein
MTRFVGTAHGAAAFVAVALGVVSAQPPASSSVLADVNIQKILVERVDTKQQSGPDPNRWTG